MRDLAMLLLCVGIGYLLGSFPTGYLVARYLAGHDVRAQGSGKTGATNVRRLLGWKGFFLVFGVDALKGALAVLAAGALVDGPDAWARALAGVAAVVGHSWSMFLGFEGGRGVATGWGAMLAMVPMVVIATSILIGIPAVLLSHYMSLGSLLGAVAIPLATLALVVYYGEPWQYFASAAAAAGLVILKHRDNIARLRTGTERRI